MTSDTKQESKEELKSLVIDAISQQCLSAAAAAESSSSDVLAFAEALSNGHKLHLTVLTGGLANYSFRAHFPTASSETPSLFAKLTFTYALLFPDKPCPINRTQCEYDAMKMFHDCAAKNPNASDVSITPYFCVDIGSDKKLLVTEYSKLDEQAANQFIDGVVDFRVASKLANSFAALHSMSDVDVTFNEEMKPFFMDLATILESIFDGFFSDKEEGDVTDRPTQLARSLGKAKLDAIYQAYSDGLKRTDCYIHGDSHLFNMLVGAKPSIETLENFAKSGDVCLVDWEMCHCGPTGKDLGFFHPFPVAAILAHTLNGNAAGAQNIMKFLDILWEEYSSAVTTDVDLIDIYKSVLSYAGVITVAYYFIGFHMEYLPIDEGNVDDLNRIKESLGVIGLRLMNLGFGKGCSPDATLSDVRQLFQDVLAEEMSILAPAKPSIRRGRRSSMLRASGRRVSDAHLYMLAGSIKDGRNSLLQAEALIAEAAEDEEEG